ncbi:MAG: carboxypeptidase-like regulatory domain-containing protein, partial [Bacteroidales bacterium]|nr:carboxypeptidase-like regulatory domain-containing protein [Bacteroidales bacterium]
MTGKRILFLILLLLPLCLRAYGQQREITGTVLDEDGLPLIGAGVVAPDGLRFSTTDLDGRFSIKAADGETLRIVILGYLEYQLLVQPGVNDYEVQMRSDMQMLEETIVVGYGAVKKSDLTGSVASVKMESIGDITSSSVDGLLQGRAAGLQVLNTSQ